MSTLLGLSGSLRAASTNTKLVRAAARDYAADEFTLADPPNPSSAWPIRSPRPMP